MPMSERESSLRSRAARPGAAVGGAARGHELLWQFFRAAMTPAGKPTTCRRGLRRRLYVDASLCLFILIGCPNGDFGRVRSSLIGTDIHNWVGRDAARDAGAAI